MKRDDNRRNKRRRTKGGLREERGIREKKEDKEEIENVVCSKDVNIPQEYLFHDMRRAFRRHAQ